jgi:ubiquinone/menaquinone biosynthesis C-methylase UbiE
MLPAPADLKPDYGIDAPGVVRAFFFLSAIGVVTGLFCWILRGSFSPWSYALANTAFWPGLTFLVTAVTMLYGSRIGKLKLRDRLVNALQLRGDERVLDIGCGRGLMLLAIAKRLTTGRAVGIDLWQSKDQSDNAITTTEENARREGVAERVELHTGDMRQLPFAENSFDVIVSSWAIHNIYDAAGRKEALQEIVRALKPGGRIALTDIRHTEEYRQVMQELGMKSLRREGPSFLFVIPSFILWGSKPA